MKPDTQQRLLSIASSFLTDGVPTDVGPLGNGLVNDTFLVITDTGRKYALQKINTAIFRDPELLQANTLLITNHIHRLLEAANEKDIDRRVLTPILTHGGASWIEDAGESWRLTLFIEDSYTHETLTPQMAYLTGKAFAGFHKQMAHKDAPTLQETIPDFHNIAFRIESLRKAADADTAGRLQSCAEQTEYLLSRADEMLEANRLHARGLLPKRIAHCDTKVNNILFDKAGNILCVIDLDTTMPGFILSDFGDFIRTGANTGAEDDPDLSKIGVDMEIYRRFATGYLEEASFLTDIEKEMLPFGAKMLTYMQAVRFLTDYLNGDTYYKTQYPDHNLVRTRAQIKLLQEIDNHYNEMIKIIAAI